MHAHVKETHASQICIIRTSKLCTTTGGVDYMAIDENVDPTVDKVTVVAFVDEVTESVESFQLYIVIPPTTPNVQVGSVPVATVFITDLGGELLQPHLIEATTQYF